MLDPGRPEFNVGDPVWVTVGGVLQFERPVRILSIHKHNDGSWWAFVEGSETGRLLWTSLKLASPDADDAQDATTPPDQGNDEQREQALNPSTIAMRVHLEHLFGGYLDGYHDGLIELAWTTTPPPNADRRSPCAAPRRDVWH